MQIRTCVGLFLYRKIVINDNTAITVPNTNTPHVGVNTEVCVIAAALSCTGVVIASTDTLCRETVNAIGRIELSYRKK